MSGWPFAGKKETAGNGAKQIPKNPGPGTYFTALVYLQLIICGALSEKDTMAINTASVQEFIEGNRASVYMLLHTYFSRDKAFLLR